MSISSDAGTWVTLDVDANGNWSHTFTNQRYATLTASAQAVDSTGLESAIKNAQVILQPPYQTVTSNLSSHVSKRRITNYDIGYGACDVLYLDLFNQYGVSTEFPLYGRDGTWCADPASLPGPTDNAPTVTISRASANDDCINTNGTVDDDNPGFSVEVTVGGQNATVNLEGNNWNIDQMCGYPNNDYDVVATATDSVNQTASDTETVTVKQNIFSF